MPRIDEDPSKEAHKLEAGKHVLYASEDSFYSQVVRLGLAEKELLEGLQRRPVNLHDKSEQARTAGLRARRIRLAARQKCSPDVRCIAPATRRPLPRAQLDEWFLKLNPKGTVPVLLKADDKVVAGSLDILRDLAPALFPKNAKVDALLKVYEGVPVNEVLYGHYIATNPGARPRPTAEPSSSPASTATPGGRARAHACGPRTPRKEVRARPRRVGARPRTGRAPPAAQPENQPPIGGTGL